MGPKPFLVYSPPFWQGSAGIFALHRLADNIASLGFEVFFKFYNLSYMSYTEEELSSRPEKFYNPDDRHNLALRRQKPPENLDSVIVIYPETLPENPLGANNVVRYVMNFPHKNMFPMVPGPRDFILAYWPEYYPKHHHHALAILPDNKDLVLAQCVLPFQSRDIDCTYIGKGVKVPGYYKINGTTEITREWPETKHGLYDLLRRTRYLFTWDPLTALNFEAVFWGAIPVYLRFAPYFEEAPEFGLAPYPFGVAQPSPSTLAYTDLLHRFDNYDAERGVMLERYKRIKTQELTLTMEFIQRAHRHFGY